jgi:cysteine desulfurase/selenocysteine lyase
LDVNKLREDFPVLNNQFNGKDIIYLDSACMSLKPIQVIDKINEYYREYPSCGGRSVHKLATRVTISVDDSRLKIQKFLNAQESNEVVFLRNATEGINLVANSLTFKPGDKVLITDREHNSNLVPWLQLQKLNKIKLEVVPSNPDNTFNLDRFIEMMDKNVKLVSMVHTSNLDGYTIPASDIIKIAHEYDALVMLDGAQSAPHKKIDVQKLDVDFFVLSIHKMCGPTGVGVLFGKFDLLKELSPYIVGGSTVKSTTYSRLEFLPPPEKFEAGLQNYAGIIGAGSAAEYLMDIGLENIEEHDIQLNKLITERLSNIDEIKMIGPRDPELRGCVFSFNINGMDSHDIAMILDEMENIMIRSGMQCVHSWFNNNNLKGSARASVYLYNKESEANIFSESVIKIIDQFR